MNIALKAQRLNNYRKEGLSMNNRTYDKKASTYNSYFAKKINETLTFNYHNAKAICMGTTIVIMDLGATCVALFNVIIKYVHSFHEAWKLEQRKQLFKIYQLNINM